MANQQLLLVDDVDDLGRKGEVVSVKPGFSRNYLLPQKKAVVADKHTLRMQARLQEERAKQAAVDRKEAEVLAENINGMKLSIEVKVDPEGHMYGSVSSIDIVRLFEQKGIVLERKNIVLPQPIKELGVFQLNLKLKEGIPAAYELTVDSDVPLPARKVVQEVKEEQPTEEAP